ncbi:hypothetical protein Dda_6515 [Drechslerella dactyloides]|uniref:Uncharacterized protein n=1 Tax=Drechslerella dactyloides TaxID=74499 RepID=A0AAD6NJ00_DREDA|nr:hypothetical protein Dda_6515 [Drechslerella dactyloides]
MCSLPNPHHHGHYDYGHGCDGVCSPDLGLSYRRPVATIPSAAVATATGTDFNVRHAHYRRIPSSQRSLSPPPRPRKPLSKVFKGCFCLPLHLHWKTDKNADAQCGDEKIQQQKEQGKAETGEPTLDASILSSEEQTRAPEGDRLPIFMRLRDWTEHERAKVEKKIVQEEEEEEMQMPPRSISMPPPPRTYTPFPRPPLEGRSASEGHITRVIKATPPRKESPREKIGFVEVIQAPPQPRLLPVVPPKIPPDVDETRTDRAHGSNLGIRECRPACPRRKNKAVDTKSRLKSQHYHHHHHHNHNRHHLHQRTSKHYHKMRSEQRHAREDGKEEADNGRQQRRLCRKHQQQQRQCQRRRSTAERIAAMHRREATWEPPMPTTMTTMAMPGAYPAEKGTWRVLEGPAQWLDVRMVQ